MEIQEVQFVQSSPGLKGMPVFDLPEFAFIGRSNVGKSSLINMICGRKGVAKVSGTPGKTRLINHFKVTSTNDLGSSIQEPISKPQDPESVTLHRSKAPFIPHRERSEHWYLVDLPGYGWAKLSKEQREKFDGMIRTYLLKRENLACTFVLIDSRLPVQKIDLEFLNWLGNEEISFIIVFTKVDKLSKTQINSNIKSYQKVLAENWEEIPSIIQISSITRQGKEILLDNIQGMLNEIVRKH
jgi:GTP-binding protein